MKPDSEIIWIINEREEEPGTVSSPHPDGHETYKLQANDYSDKCSGSGQCKVEYKIVDVTDADHVLGEGTVADLPIYCELQLLVLHENKMVMAFRTFSYIINML